MLFNISTGKELKLKINDNKDKYDAISSNVGNKTRIKVCKCSIVNPRRNNSDIFYY